MTHACPQSVIIPIEAVIRLQDGGSGPADVAQQSVRLRLIRAVLHMVPSDGAFSQSVKGVDERAPRSNENK